MAQLGSASGNKASGADFFSSDLSISTSGGDSADANVHVMIRVGTATTVKMTLDSTNYYTINSGASLVADQWYNFDFVVHKDDTINFKQDTGTIAITCRVHQRD